MAQETSLVVAYQCFSSSMYRQSMAIPYPLWKALESDVQKAIVAARDKLQKSRLSDASTKAPLAVDPVPKPDKIVDRQYPTMTPYQAKLAQSEALQDENATSLAMLCQTFHTTLCDDDNANEADEPFDPDEYEAPVYSGYMVQSHAEVPPLHVHAHLEYYNVWHGSTHTGNDYAISDSGADATILGCAAKIISQSG